MVLLELAKTQEGRVKNKINIIRIVIWVSILILFPIIAFSQEYQEVHDAGPGNFGLKFGYGNSKLGDNPNSASARSYMLTTYFTMDAFAGKIVEFTQEVGYIKKGYYGYVEINNILKVKFFKQGTTPFVFGSFYMAGLVSGVSGDYTTYNFLDYGFNIGAGVDFGQSVHGSNERWGGLEMRYSKGLKGIYVDESASDNPKNQIFMAVFRLYLFNL